MAHLPEHLVTGYRNFMNKRYSAESGRYHRLEQEGQEPETLVIACCDSRSAPETIFDAGPGELFVIRNIANMVPPFGPDDMFHGTSAAIEFAVQSLQVKHIVIMGHGRCGGIAGALDPAVEELSPGGFVSKWMGMLAPVAEAVAENNQMTKLERQTALERISIRFQLANLRTFPFVKEREDQGLLTLHGAWFEIFTGELWAMNPETGDFERPDIANGM